MSLIGTRNSVIQRNMKKFYFAISSANARKMAKEMKVSVEEFYRKFRWVLDLQAIPTLFSIHDYGCDVTMYCTSNQDGCYYAKEWGFHETDKYGIAI